MKRACVVDVYTSTYRYVPVCTDMYWWNLNFDFFEIRPHPIISLALELYAVAVCSRRAALVYEKHSCLINCIYLYVLVRTIQGILFWHVLVHTGLYRYVPVYTILPDPVQVYRIPDAGGWCRIWKPITLTSSLRLSIPVHLESPYLEFSWYIPGISQVYLSLWYIPGIYLVYTCHMKHKIYTRYITGIYQFYDFQVNLHIPGIYLVHTFWVFLV